MTTKKAETGSQPLECPEDIREGLDTYAAELSAQFGFSVSRQQAFERFARVFLTKTNEKGAADGHAD